MTVAPRARRITVADLDPLRAFLASAGASLKTFRYFASRPLDVLASHLSTWVLLSGDVPVAYGHLDVEGDTVWLGIAVQGALRGLGHGRTMMRLLLDAARGAGVSALSLSVDNDNAHAIALYKSCGFRLSDRGDRTSKWCCDLRPHGVTVSSMAFAGQPIDEIVRTVRLNGWSLEFSSGLPYRDDMEEIFLSMAGRCLAHNYFPAPASPFVLNLASADTTVRERSIEHCVRGVELSAKAGAPFFSAHSGFCVDPTPADLGRQLPTPPMIHREIFAQRFASSIREILERTFHCPAGLLVENNVLSPVNHTPGHANPLLCVEPAEQRSLVQSIGDPRFGLLFDAGHCNVSATTLGFDRVDAVIEVLPWIRCWHHSENQGTADDNGPLADTYWCLPLLARARHAVHVLEVNTPDPGELNRMSRLLLGALA